MSKHEIRVRNRLIRKGSIRQYKDFHKFKNLYVKKKRKHHTVRWLIIIVALIILLSMYFLSGSLQTESRTPMKKELEFNNTAQIL